VKISEKPLLEVLYDNFLKQAQFNTVVPSQEENGPGGRFEPTTSAAFLRFAYLSKKQLKKKSCPNLTRSTLRYWS
jgi:hypothetical protein